MGVVLPSGFGNLEIGGGVGVEVGGHGIADGGGATENDDCEEEEQADDGHRYDGSVDFAIEFA